MKIIIADDHAIVRQGLKQIILSKYRDARVYEAVDTDEVTRLMQDNPIDIIILDVTMPTKDGIEVLKDIKRDYPRIPVLILSMHPEERFAVRALKSGASGYLTKTSSPAELVDAVRKVLHGGKYITPSVAELLADSMEQGEKASVETLSGREHQVFLSLASGKTVGEIAENMDLSTNTISTYRTRILEKMSMKTNADLTRYAAENGMLE